MRRLSLAGLIAMGVAGQAAAQEPEVTLTVHHFLGPQSPAHTQFIEPWARRIEEWREQVDVYAYFNNDWAGFAVENGLWLRERLGA